MYWDRILTKGFWEQLYIALVYGDNHYPSMWLWGYWRSYVGKDHCTHYRNWAILKDYLTKS